MSKRKSQYMIQELISLNNEKKEDCTEMLLRMQHHLDNWWKDVQQRLAEKEKKPSDELIHQITYNEWTKKDIQKYKTDFVPQSCHHREVRVSLLHLSHRAQTAQKTWWIILLWYVRISEDHETLNISESETWSQLLSAHCDLVFDSSLLFTLHNMFDASPYSFSAAVQLTGLSSIFDALIGCVCWTNPTIISHLCDLLSDNDTVRNAYLCNWTVTAKWAIKTQWRKVKRIKRSVFSKKFFFYCQDQKLKSSHSDNSSSKLQEDEISTVTKSEDKRPVDHY